MSTRKIYNVTPEEKEIALFRDAKRRRLRELYLKQAGHPTKSLLFDTGMYRYVAAKTSIEKHFVPNAINWMTRFGAIVTSIVIVGLFIKKTKEAEEHLYRTGQVSYADREFKFA